MSDIQTKPVADGNHMQHGVKPLTFLAMLTALGVVYGDIGTSPLYAFKAALNAVEGERAIQPNDILCILSMIFWSLMMTVTVKYIGFVLRADNEGEGGILAFMGLLNPQGRNSQPKRLFVFLIIIFGCTMLFGDGVITPAISVISAIEGVKTVYQGMSHSIIIGLTLAILLGLFVVQSYGTEKIGKVFGPIMLGWFITMTGMGLWAIVKNPIVLQAMSPHYAIQMIIGNPKMAFVVLGAVFLCLTGGEAMYADLGHCGRKPISYAWFIFVLPAVLLNYFGQGALVLSNISAKEDPFFLLTPEWARIPLVVLATMATIIASQALISGVFSLIRQGSSLGISPRFKVKQTSNHEFGQIYLPTVNWMLMIGASILVVGFGSSDAMASAYGIAVTLTMLITTVLICLTMKEVWHWKPIYVFLFGLCFITIDLVFTVSNMMKIVDGGWVPLLIGSIAFMMMMTWSNGQDLLRQKLNSKSISKESLNNMSSCGQITRTCGTEIFLTKTDIGLPPLLCEFASKTHSIAQNAIIMNFHFSRFPFLHRKNNLKIQDLEDGFWRINVSYGYLQTPRVMAVLEEIRRMGVPVGNIHEATIIIGHETMVRKKENSEMNYFSAKLFSWMVKNSSKADQFFHIPKNQILEIGIQIEI